MSYFVYKNDKPRKYKGYSITPNKSDGTWTATKKGRVKIERSTLASMARTLKPRKR